MTDTAVEQFDNSDLRTALSEGDVEAAARALVDPGVLLARVELDAQERRVMVATSSKGDQTLVAFTSAATALEWGETELAVAQIRGGDLLEVMAEQQVPNVLIDSASPGAVSLTETQLQTLLRGQSGDITPQEHEPDR